MTHKVGAKGTHLATRNVWKSLLTLLITAGLLGFLLSQVSLSTIAGLLAHTSLVGVLAGAALYLTTNVVRALRVVTICSRPVGDTLRLFAPVLASSFANNVLPARAGEAIFVWDTHRRLGMEWGTSAAVLIIMRIFDILLVAVLFAATAVLRGLGHAPAALQLAVGVLAVGAVMTALLPWLGQYAVRLAVWLARLTRLPGLIRFVEVQGRHANDAFAQLRPPRIYLGVFLTSLVIWLLTFAWIYLLIRSIGFDMPFDQAITGSTFGVLSKSIPFTSIGGWGAHEAGWTAGFVLTGLPQAQAIASGFAVNTWIILTSAVCGLPAWLALTAARKAGASNQPTALAHESESGPSMGAV